MKKFILFFILILFVSSTTAFAEGQYDGIWDTPYGFATISENNGTIGFQILTPVYEEDVDGYVGVDWQFFYGELKGNEVQLTEISFIPETDLSTVDLIFDSVTTFRAVLRSCEPAELCQDILPLIDKEFSGEKFW